ncbi:2Fe-2S iron-sulfur cluster-binding protein [Serratia proteamaculans]|jgi:vanillate O-demethylase ferredoxin subunit|uniref:PDR/VanB family oxidoreductase n=1 Tax=Serratia proteamaculans TaxID=28151 RepID=UPI002178152D|nr:PDR/VanB family oxidoreductase [Serratia proteamaculans]CAI1238625.1 Phthalate dioxygenase reductase [Serratia proteamaculans]CAI1978594.1 Phthalate dioxygenase reductase [Serratia proteamaculans]CAI2001974.1 Phthalate dioxygenase reductase [Serratia proteamaculans]CAI2530435.1 Phthalate dioxygenase reductase [Serratia proteamaculans]
MRTVKVTRLYRLAENVMGIELTAIDERPLPPFAAGDHLDLHLPNGLIRPYSLCNDPHETHRYCLGIALANTSRGGSAYLHQQLQVGEQLTVGEPRSLFPLVPDAPRYRFIAGGIGITPIRSMILWCRRHGYLWHLDWFIRSHYPQSWLEPLAQEDNRVRIHTARPTRSEDLATAMRAITPGEHIYCCGPESLMEEVQSLAQAQQIPADRIHFERFTAGEAISEEGQAFDVELQRSGGRYRVLPGISILETLEQNGVNLPFSCREGLCRSCEVTLLAGEADHRDYVLSDEERAANRSILICVSRARSSTLVLDV